MTPGPFAPISGTQCAWALPVRHLFCSNTLPQAARRTYRPASTKTAETGIIRGAVRCENQGNRVQIRPKDMFAVIKTGGKQYKVAANDLVRVEKLAGEAGDAITFENVLMVGAGADVTLGAPLVDGALVAGEVVEQFRDKKVIVFKKKRRQGYRRKNGHRQELTLVRITEILTGGAKPSGKKAAAPKKAAKAETAKAETAKADDKPAKAEAKPAKTEKTEAAPAADFKDDVKLIGGVGPALEKKLHAAGITSLTQIAKWTKADIAKFDEELDFKGRIERDEWVDQANELIAGKPPRAKADQ